MIKNVIFDFGNVLVKYDPVYIVSGFSDNQEDIQAVASVLFDRLYWDRLDEGTIEDSEVVEESKKRLPKRLHALIEKSYYGWIDRLPEISGMSALIESLKSRGVKLYLLSNISQYFADRYQRFPILRQFDGLVFSGVIHKVKPSKEIFEYLFDAYKIKSEESVFIDDAQRNIDGAKAVGLATYLFDGDSKKLEEYLTKLIKENENEN